MKPMLAAAIIIAASCTTAHTFDLGKELENARKDYERSDLGKATKNLKPPEVVIIEEIVNGKPADEAVKTAIEGERAKLNEAGRALNDINSKTTEAIRNSLGDDAARIYEMAKLQETIANTATLVVVNKAVDVVVGKKTVEEVVQNAVGLPLEIAIQQAYEYYASNSKPIPDDIKKLLVGEFSPKIVNDARYADNKVQANIAAIINTLQTTIGTSVNGNHAVTVGNIIVFESVPGSEDIWFWAHEMTHVEQYKKWGIDGFASKYLADYKSVEKEADDRANSLIETLKIIQKFAENQASLSE